MKDGEILVTLHKRSKPVEPGDYIVPWNGTTKFRKWHK